MRLFVVFFVSLLLTSKAIAQKKEDCGAAFMRTRLYKPKLKSWILPTYERDIKFLFYDSMVIAERHGLSIDTDSKGKETWRVDVIGYTFIDFKTQSFYDYGHFSDTARMIRSMSQPAEGRVDGGWNFFDKPRSFPSPVLLADTVLNNISYHRLRSIYFKNGDTTDIKTMYYVSEAEVPVIFYGKGIINGRRVSYIREDDIDIHSGLKTYVSMDVVSHNLSKKELKIFVVWKKNAEKHPVKKIK